MKKYTLFITTLMVAILFSSAPSCLASSKKKNIMRPSPRGQWTEQQAWDWEKKVGEIRGFNAPSPAYPGQTRLDILKKASEYGLNSGSAAMMPRNRLNTFVNSQRMPTVSV